MKMKSKTYRPKPFGRRWIPAFALAALIGVGGAAETSAQVLKRGVQGGLLGAGVGALVGGGKGAAKGAAIGAAVGAVVGASERNAHGAPPPPPPPGPPPRGHANGLVYNIQVSLNRLGYDPGPIDGQYGRRTAEAIRTYEYNNQLPLTGQPSPALHNHMLQHGG